MLDANSLQSIKEKAHSDLPRKITIIKREPVTTMAYMMVAGKNPPTRYKSVRIEETRNSKLIGILFAHPKSNLAKSEIIGHLNHFHIRSGEAVDFFCAGYGAYWPENHFADQTPVTQIEGINWLFSDEAFCNMIDDLEAETNWQYSGETELLLVSAEKQTSGDIVLNYSDSIVCNLEAMAKDNAFTSVRSFFAGIFSYAKSHSDSNPTWAMSDKSGLAIGKSAIKDAILSLLPSTLKGSYLKAEHYAVRNLSNKC